MCLLSDIPSPQKQKETKQCKKQEKKTIKQNNNNNNKKKKKTNKLAKHNKNKQTDKLLFSTEQFVFERYLYCFIRMEQSFAWNSRGIIPYQISYIITYLVQIKSFLYHQYDGK